MSRGEKGKGAQCQEDRCNRKPDELPALHLKADMHVASGMNP